MKKNEHVYKAVIYLMGSVENEIITFDFNEIKKIYIESNNTNKAVRVWIDGRKLTYKESNYLFDNK